ncbi:hypothetical protein [Streptomyces sp. G1]|uniref:hypothetical protein n=1 Tax=Streptomyces sp. G1 TaxID=361572 RepID=UPI00202EC2FF|nr:hypothetical protein [Streptomyces sp. G1]MCM1965101.1 hypothetical protein [Streptomyces sp. G1]
MTSIEGVTTSVDSIAPGCGAKFQDLVTRFEGGGALRDCTWNEAEASGHAVFDMGSFGLADLANLPWIGGAHPVRLAQEIAEATGIPVPGVVRPKSAEIFLVRDGDEASRVKAISLAASITHDPVQLVEGFSLTALDLLLDCHPSGGDSVQVTAGLALTIQSDHARFTGHMSLPDGAFLCELDFGDSPPVSPPERLLSGLPLPGGRWLTGGRDPVRVLLAGGVKPPRLTIGLELPGQRGELAGITVSDITLAAALPEKEVALSGFCRIGDTSLTLRALAGSAGWQVQGALGPIGFDAADAWVKSALGHEGLHEALRDVEITACAFEVDEHGSKISCAMSLPLGGPPGSGLSVTVRASHASGGATSFTGQADLPVRTSRGPATMSLSGSMTREELSLAWAGGETGVSLNPSVLGLPVEFPDELVPSLTKLGLRRTKTANGAVWALTGSTSHSTLMLASVPL